MSKLTLEQSDEFYDLFHSKNPRDWQKGKALAKKMNLEKDPEYLEIVLMGLENYLESDDLEYAMARLFKKERQVEFEDYSDFEMDKKKAELEFMFSTDVYMSEGVGKKLGQALGKRIAQYFTKNLGLPAKVGESFFSVEDSHDMDGSEVILGSEWGQITVYVIIPFKGVIA